MNAGWVVGTLRGGGDTQTLTAAVKLVWILGTLLQKHPSKIHEPLSETFRIFFRRLHLNVFDVHLNICYRQENKEKTDINNIYIMP